MHKKIILVIIIVLVVLLIVGYYLWNNKTTKQEDFTANTNVTDTISDLEYFEDTENNIISNSIAENKINNEATVSKENTTTANINTEKSNSSTKKNTSTSSKNSSSKSSTTSKSSISKNTVKNTVTTNNVSKESTTTTNTKPNNTSNNIKPSTNNKTEDKKETGDKYIINQTIINKMKSTIEKNPSEYMKTYGYKVVVDSSICSLTSFFTYSDSLLLTKLEHRFGTIKIYARDYYSDGDYVTTECYIY